MSLTVGTGALVQVLTDALETASSITGGVHLATHRAPYKAEPGDIDLLALTSTTRYVLGHTWIPVDGHLTPAVWPIGSAKNALALCKSLAKKGDNHTVDIDMVLADPPDDPKKRDEHPGWLVTLRESAALFDSDTELQFHAHHELRFPIAGIGRMLAGKVMNKRDEEYSDEPVTLWPAHVLGPLVKVAKRRGGTIQLFRSQEHRLQVVQIGDTFLGAAYPAERLAGQPKDAPGVDPVLGGWRYEPREDEGSTILRDGAGLVGADDGQGTIDDIEPGGGEGDNTESTGHGETPGNVVQFSDTKSTKPDAD